MFTSEDITVVLVSESTGTTPLDYAVDGVVDLVTTYPLRQVREIIVRKVRGVELDKPKYLYTLQGGRFKSFEAIDPAPVLLRVPENPRPPEPLGDPQANTVSTGIQDLDDITQTGFLRGSVNVFEVGRDVGPYLSYACSSDGFERAEPRAGSCRGTIRVHAAQPAKNLSNWVSAENMEHLYVLRRTPEQINGWPQVFSKDIGVHERFEEMFQKGKGWADLGPSYAFIGLDSLQAWFGVYVLERFLGLQADCVRDYGQVDVWVVREMQEKLIDVIAPLATRWWNVDVVDCTLTLQGTCPTTNLHAVELNLGEGYPRWRSRL